MKMNWISTLKKSKASTLVVFTQQAKSGKKAESQLQIAGLTAPMKRFVAEWSDAKKDHLITGKLGEVLLFRSVKLAGFKNLIFVGLGSIESKDVEAYRSAGGSLESCLTSNSINHACLNLDTLTQIPTVEMVQALAEGLYLGAYRFDELKTKNDNGKKTELTVEIHSAHQTKDFQGAMEQAKIMTECVNFSRRLGDMPGNLMNPSILAKEAQHAGKEAGLKVTVWDKARIEKEKMGGLLGVSTGSAQEPRFIIMEYSGAKSTEKPVVFVGKGLTFDTGGISIKPSAAMEEMKYDMCGGANVIGTMLAIAKLKLKINAIGLVPATENMPGCAATKPGDVHTARNGKTFEVNNTDAEGRLILADALCYASEMKPQVIIDAATLTGAIVVALGNTHTGFFTRNADLKKKVDQAAENSGEWVWQMPLCDFHSKDMKGTFADLSNMSCSKGAGSATAAAFLENFVEKDIPWAHFDIAGTAWAVGNRLTYCSKKGASGAMVRTFVELAKLYQE